MRYRKIRLLSFFDKVYGEVRRSRIRLALSSALLAISLIATVATAAPPASADSNAGASYDFTVSGLSGGATGRYCFHYGNHALAGPVAVTALNSANKVEIQTISTDLEHRGSYGWVYCATLRNSSMSASSTITVTTRAQLVADYSGNFPQASLAPGASGYYCFSFNNHGMEGPAAVIAEANSDNVILTTVSTNLEQRPNYGWVYCTTIHNSSTSASTFTLAVQSYLAFDRAPIINSDLDPQYSVAPSATREICDTEGSLHWSPLTSIAYSTVQGAVLTVVSTGQYYTTAQGYVFNCTTVRNDSTQSVIVELQLREGV